MSMNNPELLVQKLRQLADAAKKPLDDMDKHRCWPPGEEPTHDHAFSYYWLRCLIAEVDKLGGKHDTASCKLG